MQFFNVRLRRLIDKWPGKRIFREYRFLPIFFICGAVLEFSMINWHVGEVNFYKTYKRRIVEEQVEERLRQEAWIYTFYQDIDVLTYNASWTILATLHYVLFSGNDYNAIRRTIGSSNLQTVRRSGGSRRTEIKRETEGATEEITL